MAERVPGEAEAEWAAQFTDDEWDSVVASANTGSSEDFSHLDDVDLELTCDVCSKRVMEGVVAGDFFYCSTYCMASDGRLTPLQALTARRTEDELGDDG